MIFSPKANKMVEPVLQPDGNYYCPISGYKFSEEELKQKR